MVLVRNVICNITANAFSIDGGRSWEINWIATDTRLGAPPAPPPAPC